MPGLSEELPGSKRRANPARRDGLREKRLRLEFDGARSNTMSNHEETMRTSLAKPKKADLIFTSTDSQFDYRPEVLGIIEEMIEQRMISRPGESTRGQGPLVDSLQQIYAQRNSLKMRPFHIPKGHVYKGRWLLGLAAALIHMTGEELADHEACARCREGRGLYAACIQHKEVDQGSCSNCVQVGHLHQCSLRKREVTRADPASSARQSERTNSKQHSMQEANIANRAPRGVLKPNSAPAASSVVEDIELTAAQQSRITVALSMRKDDLNDVRMPFEDCETFAGLLSEIVEGPYHGLVKSQDAIRAVWLSADCDADASKLYLRPSKQSSAESYRQFLGRDVKSRLEQEGSTCVISVVVEI